MKCSEITEERRWNVTSGDAEMIKAFPGAKTATRKLNTGGGFAYIFYLPITNQAYALELFRRKLKTTSAEVNEAA